MVLEAFGWSMGRNTSPFHNLLKVVSAASGPFLHSSLSSL